MTTTTTTTSSTSSTSIRYGYGQSSTAPPDTPPGLLPHSNHHQPPLLDINSNYNYPIHIASAFIIMSFSMLGVVVPFVFLKMQDGYRDVGNWFTGGGGNAGGILSKKDGDVGDVDGGRQGGDGVILSTAFIHMYAPSHSILSDASRNLLPPMFNDGVPVDLASVCLVVGILSTHLMQVLLRRWVGVGGYGNGLREEVVGYGNGGESCDDDDETGRLLTSDEYRGDQGNVAYGSCHDGSSRSSSLLGSKVDGSVAEGVRSSRSNFESTTVSIQRQPQLSCIPSTSTINVNEHIGSLDRPLNSSSSKSFGNDEAMESQDTHSSHQVGNGNRRVDSSPTTPPKHNHHTILATTTQSHPLPRYHTTQTISVPESHNHHHHHHHLSLLQESTLTTYILELGIALHSVIIGVTLGLTTTTNDGGKGEFASLMIALGFHQFFEGVAVCTVVLEGVGMVNAGGSQVEDDGLFGEEMGGVTDDGSCTGGGFDKRWNYWKVFEESQERIEQSSGTNNMASSISGGGGGGGGSGTASTDASGGKDDRISHPHIHVIDTASDYSSSDCQTATTDHIQHQHHQHNHQVNRQQHPHNQLSIATTATTSTTSTPATSPRHQHHHHNHNHIRGSPKLIHGSSSPSSSSNASRSGSVSTRPIKSLCPEGSRSKKQRQRAALVNFTGSLASQNGVEHNINGDNGHDVIRVEDADARQCVWESNHEHQHQHHIHKHHHGHGHSHSHQHDESTPLLIESKQHQNGTNGSSGSGNGNGLGVVAFGFAISLTALYLVKQPATHRHSYGFARVEILGAILSTLLIWVLTGYIVLEAVERVQNPQPIDGRIMFWTALMGVVVNIVLASALHEHHGHSHGHGHGHGHSHSHGHGHSHGGKAHSHGHSHGDHEHEHGHQHHEITAAETKTGWGFEWMKWLDMKHVENMNINVRSAAIHVIGDLLFSIGVLLASITIMIYPTLTIIDPLCTFLFSIFVMMTTISLMSHSLGVLMEATPADLDPRNVEEVLLGVENVVDVHDLHVWCLSAGKMALTCHLRLRRWVDVLDGQQEDQHDAHEHEHEHEHDVHDHDHHTGTVNSNITIVPSSTATPSRRRRVTLADYAEALTSAQEVLCSKFGIHHATIQIDPFDNVFDEVDGDGDFDDGEESSGSHGLEEEGDGDRGEHGDVIVVFGGGGGGSGSGSGTPLGGRKQQKSQQIQQGYFHDHCDLAMCVRGN
ncbi:Metal tolerance protein 1 [Blyttiomyces sp. JEL0837]|nr:Metal tolerance protein 1 [Blyttiomyces sp. JEL0837]